MQILKENDVSALSSVIRKFLYMYGTTWVYESIFSTGNFMKSKHRWSISNENLASKLIYNIKYTPNFRLSAEKRL